MEMLYFVIYGASAAVATVLAADMFLNFFVQKTILRKFVSVLFFVPTALIAFSAISNLVK